MFIMKFIARMSASLPLLGKNLFGKCQDRSGDQDIGT
jgi:hypothetical protein